MRVARSELRRYPYELHVLNLAPVVRQSTLAQVTSPFVRRQPARWRRSASRSREWREGDGRDRGRLPARDGVMPSGRSGPVGCRGRVSPHPGGPHVVLGGGNSRYPNDSYTLRRRRVSLVSTAADVRHRHALLVEPCLGVPDQGRAHTLVLGDRVHTQDVDLADPTLFVDDPGQSRTRPAGHGGPPPTSASSRTRGSGVSRRRGGSASRRHGGAGPSRHRAPR